MNGFMTLLTGALALLTLGLLVLLMGGGSYADSPGSIASPVTEQDRVQVNPLPELSAGGSDTCQEDGDVFRDEDKGQLTGTTASIATREPEAGSSSAPDNIKDLKLPDGLSLSIAGTGEYCSQ